MSMLRALTRSRRILVAAPPPCRVLPGMVPPAPCLMLPGLVNPPRLLRSGHPPSRVPFTSTSTRMGAHSSAQQSPPPPPPLPMSPTTCSSLAMLPEDYVKCVLQVKDSVKGQQEDIGHMYNFFWLICGLLCTVGVGVPWKINEFKNENDQLRASQEASTKRQDILTGELAELKIQLNKYEEAAAKKLTIEAHEDSTAKKMTTGQVSNMPSVVANADPSVNSDAKLVPPEGPAAGQA